MHAVIRISLGPRWRIPDKICSVDRAAHATQLLIYLTVVVVFESLGQIFERILQVCELLDICSISLVKLGIAKIRTLVAHASAGICLFLPLFVL